MKPTLDNVKPLILVIFFLIISVFGFAFLVSAQGNTILSDISVVGVQSSSYELGQIPINGGTITKEYQLKNISNEPIKLKKITTSCMCTKAKVVTAQTETRFFSLEHAGDKNAPVNLEIKPQQEFKVLFEFDPNAHGPAGVGNFDRTIQLIFSQPQGLKELKFSGIVI